MIKKHNLKIDIIKTRMEDKMKQIIIELLPHFYPIYKNICTETGEKPCLYGCINMLQQLQIIPQLKNTNLPMITHTDILDYKRNKQVAHDIVKIRQNNQQKNLEKI